MIRALFAIPVIIFFCVIMFVMYIACMARLAFTGKIQIAFGFVNSLFSSIICLFFADLNDWCSGRGFGNRLDNFMGD